MHPGSCCYRLLSVSQLVFFFGTLWERRVTDVRVMQMDSCGGRAWPEETRVTTGCPSTPLRAKWNRAAPRFTCVLTEAQPDGRAGQGTHPRINHSASNRSFPIFYKCVAFLQFFLIRLYLANVLFHYLRSTLIYFVTGGSSLFRLS